MMTNFCMGTSNRTMHQLTRQGKLWLEFTSFMMIEFNFAISPDLKILDFFIFPYVKNTIFKNNPPNLGELQEAISNACNAITVQMLENASENMQRRVNSCIEAGEKYFEHFL
jgi:hypothetical protein